MASSKLSRSRRVAFGAVGVAALFLATELLARAVSFQLRSPYSLALGEAFDGGWAPPPEQVANRAGAKTARLYRLARESLTQPVGVDLLAELKREYRSQFAELVEEVKACGSKFVLLNFLSQSDSEHGRLMATIATEHGVDYLDISGDLGALPRPHTMLRPFDYHLSRYGNAIVGQFLAKHIDRYRGYSSGREYDGTPRLLGDFPGSIGDPRNIKRHRVCRWHPQFAFTVSTNAQGFRNRKDVSTKKDRQRVLCIGDSYTFCIHVNQADTFTEVVERLRPDLEMINAGISGYTIRDQLSLFREIGPEVAPDITVLQVCDNDLIDLSAWNQNSFGRTGRGSYTPSEVEDAYFSEMRRLLKDKERQEAQGPK